MSLFLKVCLLQSGIWRSLDPNYSQTLTQKRKQRNIAMREVDQRIVMMDWLERSIMLLLGMSYLSLVLGYLSDSVQ